MLLEKVNFTEDNDDRTEPQDKNEDDLFVE